MNDSSKSFTMHPIGYVERSGGEIHLKLLERYIPALKELHHFSHVIVLWWADEHDNDKNKNIFQTTPPYGEDPPLTGVFATRSEYRPNPIALTTARIVEVDYDQGIVKVANFDAFDNSPILDLKAYFPVCDRVEDATIPKWLVDWPEWLPEEGLGLWGTDDKRKS
ncbi:MAG: tRNA (N6-threonylcarbamoyladenosine(37)-N6)-methyltransferase TrmO [Candidatus Kariarchaeaceae archaeon]